MKSSISARFNADLLDQKYEQWCENPESVEADWCAFFEGFELGNAQLEKRKAGGAQASAEGAQPAGNLEVQSSDEHYLNFRGKVVSLIYNYRTLGHTQAHLDPLAKEGIPNPRLQLEQFG